MDGSEGSRAGSMPVVVVSALICRKSVGKPLMGLRFGPYDVRANRLRKPKGEGTDQGSARGSLQRMSAFGMV